MNKYVRKLFGVVFQSQQTPPIVRSQTHQSSTSPEEWRQHWQSRGQPWRTEPEIDAKRQEELSKRRAIVPDIEKGIYPFKGMKLSRADVEWLLATHENGLGPVDWSDESQRARVGLDLRGANLSQENLRGLPLARMQGGITKIYALLSTEGQKSMAAVNMNGADLSKAELQETAFGKANLYRANLHWAQLQEADLTSAQLQEADLREARLQNANLNRADLSKANLTKASLNEADLTLAQLQEADLREAQLQKAILLRAQLQKAILVRAQLQGVDLRWAELDGAYLDYATLGDEKSGSARLVDVRWGDINLAVVNWTPVKVLRDEREARQTKQIEGYQAAVRANRQLAVKLQAQGLNEDADRFAYRAQVLQRKVLWKQRNFWKWLGSAILALLAGYGYRMWRILVAYLFIVLLCAAAYFVLGVYYEPHLSFLEAVLTSITAFHGRVFSEPFLRPGEPQLWVTAFEAVAGLVIEGVFIAMLAQKFFGK